MGDDLAIVCPDALADTAYEIVGTPFGYDTAGKRQEYGCWSLRSNSVSAS